MRSAPCNRQLRHHLHTRFCECDGSLDPRQLSLVTGPLEAGQADLVLGRRRTQQRDAWPLPARLATGNWPGGSGGAPD
jgi:hypothetical protein